MAEKVIVELEFDQEEADKRSISLAQSIKGQTAELKKLREETKNSNTISSAQAKELINVERALKGNKKEYNDVQKSIVTADNAQKASTKTIEGLRSRLSGLTADLNKTEVGSERFKELQEATKDTSDELKELEQSVGDNRRSVGDYSGALEEGTANLSFFGINVGKLVGGFGLSTKAVEGQSTALRVLKFALAATGIGAIVLLLAGLVKAFTSSEENANKLNKVMSVFTGIMNGVLDILRPVSEFLFDKIIVGFEKAGEVVGSALELISSGLEAIGFESAAAGVDSFTASIAGAIDTTSKLEDAEARLLEAQRLQGITQLEFLRRAELLRQVRDDESKSISERIKANAELGAVLKEQLSTELALAQEALTVSKLRIRAEGDSTEALNELAEANEKIAEIRERITGQESEQLTNLNSLRRDASAEQKERAQVTLDEAIEATKVAIDLAKQQTDAQIANLEEGEQKRIIIENERAKREAQAVIDEFGKTQEADVLLEELEITHQANLDEISAFAKEERFLIQQEDRLAALELKILEDEEDLSLLIEAQDLRTESILANEQLTQDQKKLIIAKNEKAIEKIKDDARKRQIQKDAENARTAQQIIGAVSSFFSAQKQLELEDAGDNAEKKKQIQKDFADKELAITVATIIAGTALALIQSLAQLGPIAGAVAAVLVAITGAAQIAIAVRQRNAIKALAHGGVANKQMMVGGKSHSQGGTKYYGDDGNVFEAERDELITVVNKNSVGMLNGLSNWNEAGGGVKFAGRGGAFLQDGGLAQRAITDPVDTKLSVAEQILGAIESIPAPIVTVEDINAGVANDVEVRERAEI